MLTHPTLEQLQEMRLLGFAQALKEQMEQRDLGGLDFMARLSLLVDREASYRADRRLQTRLKQAKLRQRASVEDVDFRAARGLDKRLFLSLSSCRWIHERLNLLLTGPTGAGKSYLACALGQKACREGHTVQYHRMTRLLGDLSIARGDGRYPKLMASLAKTDLLILDDWGLGPLTDLHRRDLLELLEDRHDRRSTLVTSQLPVEAWHDWIADPTLADAILDRLVHNAYRLELKGESMRKKRGLQPSIDPETEAPRKEDP